jgi:hypothetical protein
MEGGANGAPHPARMPRCSRANMSTGRITDGIEHSLPTSPNLDRAGNANSDLVPRLIGVRDDGDRCVSSGNDFGEPDS